MHEWQFTAWCHETVPNEEWQKMKLFCFKNQRMLLSTMQHWLHCADHTFWDIWSTFEDYCSIENLEIGS